MIRNSLIIRVLVTSFLLLALPLIIYSFIFFNRSYNESVENAKETLREAGLYRIIALEKMAPVNAAFLRSLENLLHLSDDFQTLPNQQFNEKLASYTKLEKKLDVFIVGKGSDENYKVLASDADEDVGKIFINFSQLENVGVKGRGNFIQFIFSKERNKVIPYLYSAVSINKNDETLGYILVRFNIEEEMENLMLPAHENTMKIYFALVKGAGYVEVASDKNLVGHNFKNVSPRQKKKIAAKRGDPENLFGDRTIPITRESDKSLFEFKWDGEMQMGVLASSFSYEDGVLAYTSKKEIFGSAIRQFIFIYALFGFIVVFGGGITIWISQWMAKPLEQLLKLMHNIQEGKFHTMFHKEKFGFELNDIGNAFNSTMSSLSENMHKAENERVKKELYKKEIEVARSVQMKLLPSQMPQLETAEVYATYFSQINSGGDFYDVFTIGDNLFLICGDAAGIGISAALYSLNIRSLIRSYSHLYQDVDTIMAKANDAFCEDTEETGMFVTAIIGIYNLKTQVFTYYSSGHVPCFVRRNEGEVVTLDQKGMALGLKMAEKYTLSKIVLNEGDIIVFYTDGLIEAVNEKNQNFSIKRIKAALQQKNWHTAHDVVEGLKNEVKQFIGSTPQEEEIVILSLKVI